MSQRTALRCLVSILTGGCRLCGYERDLLAPPKRSQVRLLDLRMCRCERIAQRPVIVVHLDCRPLGRRRARML